MKYKYLLNGFISMFMVCIWFSLDAQTYTFSNCGATGRFGPTQAQANLTYSGTSLAGAVTIINDGVQEWTPPISGIYQITAVGARGGNASSGQGGKGASMQGEIILFGGQNYRIIVGQTGEDMSYNTGGGGGSFVWKANETTEPLIAAGGGGGGGYSYSGSDASTGNNGTNGYGSLGTTGTGGFGANPGGAGWKSDGANYLGTTACAEKCSGGGAGISHGGATPLTTIGYHGCAGTSSTGDGGFGGGSGGNGYCTSSYGGGGGGGYSGGVGQTGSSAGGGGGGSYNSGNNQLNTAGVGTGHGSVVITLLVPMAGPNQIGTASIDAPIEGDCAGTYPFSVTIRNGGNNQVTSASVSWTKNGGSVNTQSWTGLLDTINGSGSTEASVSLGNISVTGNTTLKVWTSMPNGQNDTVNLDDTLEVSWYASDPSISVDDFGICDGAFEILNVESNEWMSYEWDDNSTQPIRLINSAGTYSVTATDTFGCPASDQFVVSAGVTPVVNMGTQINGCGSAVLNSGTAGGTYMWNTGATTQSITVTESGVYLVTVTSAEGCIGDGGSNVTIFDIPEVDLGNDKAICGDKGESVVLNAGNFVNYQWSTGQTSSNIIVSGNQGWPTGKHEFWVIVVDENGCSATDTVSVNVKRCIAAGISNVAGNSGFVLYPNPATNMVTISMANNTNATSVEVVDVMGRTVKQLSGQLGNVVEVELDGLAPGNYTVKAASEGQTFTNSLIIR